MKFTKVYSYDPFHPWSKDSVNDNCVTWRPFFGRKRRRASHATSLYISGVTVFGEWRRHRCRHCLEDTNSSRCRPTSKSNFFQL